MAYLTTAIYQPESPARLFVSVDDNLGGGFAAIVPEGQTAFATQTFGIEQPFAFNGTGYSVACPSIGHSECLIQPGETIAIFALPAPPCIILQKNRRPSKLTRTGGGFNILGSPSSVSNRYF